MKIIFDNPPNYADIAARFGAEAIKNAVFTFGDTIYAPTGVSELPPDLIAHEEAHSLQQSEMGVKNWWDLYFTDASFRLSAELDAYREQYRYAVENYDRPRRRQLLKRISKDLSRPMYGRIIDKHQAEVMIEDYDIYTTTPDMA